MPHVIVVDSDDSTVVVAESVSTPVEVAASSGPPGDKGDQGDPGIQGPPGLSGGSYAHDQSTASAIWSITHNLGYKPNVSIVDSAGSQVEGDVVYLDLNSLEVHFAFAFGGWAYLS
jgi:hypothetical protein